VSETDPDVVVEAPGDVEVDSRASNVTAKSSLGPLPPPPHPKSHFHVMMHAPEYLLTDRGQQEIQRAAAGAGAGTGEFTVQFQHATAVKSEVLDSLTAAGRREGVRRIRVVVDRRG